VACAQDISLSGQPATAFTEIVSYKRLRSGLWGRLLELGVAKAC
jgi:hypothetical protein